MWNKTTNKSAVLDLPLTNEEKLVRNMTNGAGCGYNGHEMANFSILGGIQKVTRRLKNPELQENSLFRELVGRILTEAAFKGKAYLEGQRMP